MADLKHVIIGTGPAGINAATTIRSLNEEDEILVLTEEAHLPYIHPLLPDFMAGRLPYEKLWLQTGSYFEEAEIEIRLRTRIVDVRPLDNVVVAEDGQRISFDRLLIACGGKPRLPSIRGMDEAKPLTLKTLADAQHMLALAEKGSVALVLGRDLVGVEVARAFCQMGIRVTYIEWDDTLLPGIIDPATAEELESIMRAAGIHMVLGEDIIKVETAGGSVSVLTSRTKLTGDFLVVAIGMAPNTDWLHASGIAMRTGIIADERLRTNYPNIYAAGDVAEIYDPSVNKRRLLFGWRNAVKQGQTAAANMCGDFREVDVSYAPGVKQIFGVDVRHRWK
ncbi:MAG: FAD-dependent oxidoreductase [Candidatus Abyssubacteria bacterium]